MGDAKAKLSTKVIVIAAVLLLTSLVVGYERAQAQQEIGPAGLSGELKSLTALAFPESDEILLSVPAGNNFVLTQLCRSTLRGRIIASINVGGGGTSSQTTLDNTVCQEYTPGLIFYGGDDVVFRNNNGSLTVRVVANGILTKSR